MKRDAKLLLLVAVLLYSTIFTFVESNANIFGMNIIQNAAGIALLATFIILYSLANGLKPKIRAKFMAAFASLGVIFSILMTYAHYASASEFCPKVGGGQVPCDIVNQSIYAEIMGVPVAVFGIIGYAVMAYVAWCQANPKKKFEILKNPLTLHILAVLALLFAVYLNYIQFAILKTLCLFCEMSAGTVITLTLISYQNWRGE
ncbi:MAG: vitamin K epoxide reductase family protein [Candidatus Nanoarchaeia archaeon]